MTTVLFVCSANRFRSVIAEEQFRQLIRTRPEFGELRAESAGTWAKPGLAPTQQAIDFCRRNGWSVEKIRSREVSEEMLERSDLILTMTQGQQEAIGLEFPQSKARTYLLSEICERQKYDISDPFENPEVEWNEVGNEVCSLIRVGFSKICRQAINDSARM